MLPDPQREPLRQIYLTGAPIHAARKNRRRALATLMGRNAGRRSIVEVYRVQLLLHRRKRHSDIGRFHGTVRRYR